MMWKDYIWPRMQGSLALNTDQVWGGGASPTATWMAVAAICAAFSAACWIIHQAHHGSQLAKAARQGLDQSDEYGRGYIDELLGSLGREREEDGRAIFVLRLSLWILVWLVSTAIAFFVVGEVRSTPQEIEDGSFIFRNNEGFTAALALIIALASSAMAPIYVELLNKRRARELEIRAAQDQLQAHLRQISQRMDAVWSHFEDVVFPFVRNWLVCLSRVPEPQSGGGQSSSIDAMQLRLTKAEIESIATWYSEQLHGDQLFQSYCESNLITPEDRSAFTYLLRRWRSNDHRVPWADESPNSPSTLYRNGTVFSKEGQQSAESKLLSLNDMQSPLRQVLRWGETHQPDFSQSEKSSAYRKLRSLREGWVTAHALTNLPKRDMFGPNATIRKVDELQGLQRGDWYAWMSMGHSLCEPLDDDPNSRRKDIADFYQEFSNGIDGLFPSSELTLVPLIWATDVASMRSKDDVVWSIRGLRELQKELDQRTRRHFEVVERSVASARATAQVLGLNIESLVEDAELFLTLCTWSDVNDGQAMNSGQTAGADSEVPSDTTKTNFNESDKGARDWARAHLARLLYYGIVLLRMKKTQVGKSVGADGAPWQTVRASFDETYAFAKSLSIRQMQGQTVVVDSANWLDIRRLLEASRARSAVHNLSRAALAAARRERMIEVSASVSGKRSDKDLSSIDSRLRSEIRLAVFKRQIGIPLEATTRLRLAPLAEIVSPLPPVFLEKRLDLVVAGVAGKLGTFRTDLTQ
jgi:hypothetical protein